MHWGGGGVCGESGAECEDDCAVPAVSVAVLPGALTPTEIVTAWEAGADVVKVFPAGAMGGASYLRSLKGPLPQIEMIPTGGVSLAYGEGVSGGGGVCAGRGVGPGGCEGDGRGEAGGGDGDGAEVYGDCAGVSGGRLCSSVGGCLSRVTRGFWGIWAVTGLSVAATIWHDSEQMRVDAPWRA